MKDTGSYAESVARHARITALKLLAEAPEYTLNESMLRELMAGFAVTYSRDQVAGLLAWLDEQGLATVEDAGGLRIAKITSRGEDVAAGRAKHPGVKRPGPR